MGQANPLLHRPINWCLSRLLLRRRSRLRPRPCLRPRPNRGAADYNERPRRPAMYSISIAISIGTSELWEESSACLQTLPVRVVFEQAGVDDPGIFLEKVEQTAPDVVLLDVAHSQETLPELIRQIGACTSHPEG